ncbi:hypothetical protein [Chondromyces crocatus]|uniref:Porin n=1 Tax=Chondromyces crocatus TaxID=52 RepID=A0A0K1E5G2_CHOCO|nr:hypothetical protein [Chondromyces crocatus]AKT36111.1 uncharacterized protein CMC5_002240 [Chondromyces crocatus]
MLLVEPICPERGVRRSRGRSQRLPRLLLALVLPLFVLLVGERAWAYPWMIRHDYTSCSTCHIDPSGAGLMTLYGRAQSEVLLRTRYGEPPADEDPSKLGGFLFGAIPLPEQLLVQADVRSLLLHVRPPSPAPTVTRYMLMQADAAAGAVIDRFRASVSLGYVPEGALGASVTHGEEHRLVSRQHWAGVVLGESEAFMLRAGRMNLPYGLRIIEHTMWARSATLTDINAAQQHGLAFSYVEDAWRMEVMAIIGNLQLSPPDLRERGYSGYVERAFGQNLAVGVSSLITYTDTDLATQAPLFRHAHGVFARYVPVKPVVIMAEGDFLMRSSRDASIQAGATGMLQVDVEPIQGVHFIGTGEVLNNDFSAQGASLGGWLSANWFFAPHADVRFDFNYRNVPIAGSRAGVTSLLGQLHVFL